MSNTNNSHLSAEESFSMITENLDNPDVIIMDIRTPDEYDTYHIQNAILIDFYSDTFQDEIAALNKDKIYLIYCRTGRRTGTDDNNAFDLMLKLGFSRVYNLSGGIHALVKIPDADDIIV